MLKLSRQGEAALFAAVALALALGLSLIPGVGIALYGWTPALAVVVVLLVTGQIRSRAAWRGLGLGVAGFRLWIPAVALPVLVLSTGYLVARGAGLTGLSLPDDVSPLRFGITWLILIPAGTLSALGEELGWRGFLLPRLAHLGRVRAGLAIGSLWAAWHIPAILISGAYHGGADAPFLVLFTLTVIAITFVSNELRIASGSTWPPTILHGAHNATWDQLRSTVVRPSGSLDLVAGEVGAVPLLLYGAVAVWIVATRPAWHEAPSVPTAGQAVEPR